MADQMYRVMLAGPSLLYAPLYLAKIERLSYSYRWITFCYPTLHDVIGQEEGQHDPVYYKLLSPVQDHDVILAVADPFRLRYKNSTGHDPSAAVVVGGLIQKMCLWLVSDRNGFDLSKDNFKDHFNQIVVHRKEMTSYALTRALLKDRGVSDPDAQKLIFQNARLGEEHIWASRRPRYNSANNKLPFAYFTGDRNHAMEQYSRRAFAEPIFNHLATNYTDVLFTGLVTTQQHWTQNRELVDDLVEGVKKAIKIIYDDPEWAAKCLIRDAQLCKQLLGQQDETQIKQYLLALKGIEAYVKTPDLRSPQATFDNGFAIHEKAQPNDASNGILDKAALQPVFSNVLATALGALQGRTAIHHVEPSESTEHPSSSLLTWFGALLGFLVSLFSLARVVAKGNASFIAHTKVKLIADWLAGNSIIGANTLTHLDWPDDKWLGTLMSAGALACMLPALNEFLGGKSDKFFRNSIVIVACTVAVMSLIYTLADWNTVVGALCNWAVVCFAYYRFARRFWVNRLSPRKWLIAKWAAILLFINRTCHATVELVNRQNKTEPLQMRLLWKLLPRLQ